MLGKLVGQIEGERGLPHTAAEVRNRVAKLLQVDRSAVAGFDDADVVIKNLIEGGFSHFYASCSFMNGGLQATQE